MFDDAFFSRPAHLINRAARMMNRLGDERLRIMGFSSAHFPVLAALKDGAALPQKELAARAQIEQSSMAQMLNRMERDGLIRRTPDPEDKRSSLISLTETARDRLPDVRAMLVDSDAELMAGMSHDDIATLRRLLKIIIGNMKAMET